VSSQRGVGSDLHHWLVCTGPSEGRLGTANKTHSEVGGNVVNYLNQYFRVGNSTWSRVVGVSTGFYC
jgi:hypothetical protein